LHPVARNIKLEIIPSFLQQEKEKEKENIIYSLV
jgi:hypothetical protein